MYFSKRLSKAILVDLCDTKGDRLVPLYIYVTIHALYTGPFPYFKNKTDRPLYQSIFELWVELKKIKTFLLQMSLPFLTVAECVAMNETLWNRCQEEEFSGDWHQTMWEQIAGRVKLPPYSEMVLRYNGPTASSNYIFRGAFQASTTENESGSLAATIWVYIHLATFLMEKHQWNKWTGLMD